MAHAVLQAQGVFEPHGVRCPALAGDAGGADRSPGRCTLFAGHGHGCDEVWPPPARAARSLPRARVRDTRRWRADRAPARRARVRRLQELYTRGNSVIWSSGEAVRKRCTMGGPVLDAVWCHFRWDADGDDGAEPTPSLCVLQADLVTVYAASGSSYSMPLPCRARSIWPLPCGFLLQHQAAPPLSLIHI